MTQDAMVPFRKYLRATFRRNIEAINPHKDEELDIIVRCLHEFEGVTGAMNSELRWEPAFDALWNLFMTLDIHLGNHLFENLSEEDAEKLNWIHKCAKSRFAGALKSVLREES